MKCFLVALALSLLATVHTHTVFTNLYVDGVDQGDGTCIRMSNNFQQTSWPVEPVTSDDMACGINGEIGVARVCPVKAGSSIAVEFREKPNDPTSQSLDPPHKGPCAIYMKKVDDASASNNAKGDGWFKIYSSTYDSSTSQWCTSKMIAQDGHLGGTIPSDLPAGDYLIRTELLALHFAVNNPPDPQFFIGCAQVYVNGDGQGNGHQTVSIPDGYVSIDKTPGLTFNIYDQPLKLPYPEFGPPVYSSSSSSSRLIARDDSSGQSTGLLPSNAILENANWWGVEIPSYSNVTGCWASSNNCWDQSRACFAQAPPTGAANCYIWNDKCTGVNQQCEDADKDREAGGTGEIQGGGPPDKGKVLTPAKKQLTWGTGQSGMRVKRRRVRRGERKGEVVG